MGLRGCRTEPHSTDTMSHRAAPNTSDTRDLHFSAVTSLCFSLTIVGAPPPSNRKGFSSGLPSNDLLCGGHSSLEQRAAFLQRPVAITSQSALAARRRVTADKCSVYPELTRWAVMTARHRRHATDPCCSSLLVAFLCLLAIR